MSALLSLSNVSKDYAKVETAGRRATRRPDCALRVKIAIDHKIVECARCADSVDHSRSHTKHPVSAVSSVHVEPCFPGLFAHRRDIAVVTARRDAARQFTQTLEIKPF